MAGNGLLVTSLMRNGRQSHKFGSLKNLTLLLVIFLCLMYGFILMSHIHGYSSKRIIIVTDKELLSIDAIQVDHCYVCICLGADIRNCHVWMYTVRIMR